MHENDADPHQGTAPKKQLGTGFARTRKDEADCCRADR
jgi:hypothetical protein